MPVFPIASAPHWVLDHGLCGCPTAFTSSEFLSAAGYAQEKKSSIISIGLTIHTCPVELREKLAVPEAEWPRAIQELCSYPHIEEAAVLSTCNRMEIYVVAVSFHRGGRPQAWGLGSCGQGPQIVVAHATAPQASCTSWAAPGAVFETQLSACCALVQAERQCRRWACVWLLGARPACMWLRGPLLQMHHRPAGDEHPCR